MLDLLEMCSFFGGSVVFSAVQKHNQDQIDGIMMCSPSMTDISDQYVYIGLPDDADRLLKTWDGQNCLNLVVAECSDSQWFQAAGRYREEDCLNLVISPLPLSEVYNQLFRNICVYKQWEKQLDAIPAGEESLKRILGAAVSMLDHKVSLYVLSPAFRVLESFVSERSTDRIGSRLNNNGYLTNAQLHFVLESLSEEKKTAYQTEPIVEGNEIVGYLLMVKETDAAIPRGFVKVLLRFVSRHLADADGLVTASNRDLVKLLSNIMVYMPDRDERVQHRLQNLPYKLGPFVRLLLIRRTPEERLNSQLVSELKNIFPRNNIAPFDKHIVALFSGPSFLHRPEIDEKAFEKLLEKYNTHAIFSNAFFTTRGLRTLYIQSRQMLELLPHLDITDGKRYAYFEDIGEYYRVYLCYLSTKENYGHDMYIYLGHPVITELRRYDEINGTDMRDFVFAYINNDCSILKTAESTHLHRNTVINKLNKIKSQLGIDLNDKSLRRELLFSCQLIHFAERMERLKNRNR